MLKLNTKNMMDIWYLCSEMVDQQVATPTYSLFGAKSDSWPLSHTQWGSQNQTCPVFKWLNFVQVSNCVWFSNGVRF